MRVLKFVLVVLLLGVAFGGGYLLRDRRPGTTAGGPERKVLYWVDPMHPSYKSDKPGIAPDCGMKLEPVYADSPTPLPGATRKVLFYRDPKEPTYTATVAGVNPETGNTLEPVYAEAAAAAPPGTVQIPVERQQLAGVRYATVEATDLGRTLRTVGKVGYDETRVQHVHPRIEGWIDRVLVDFTGQFVKAGQPMLTIYSPEMLASQEELLLARRARDQMRDNPLAGAAEQGESLFRAARRRLELWQLSDQQIDQVLQTGTPLKTVTLYSPAAGFVLERNAFPNQRVSAESDLYTLADLSRVWIMADVYEADLGTIREGAAATVTLPYTSSSAAIAAKVNYVQPAVDPVTRTLKLRLEAANPGLRLRPEMFVDVEFRASGTRRLTVPAEAVLNSGERQVVFVDLGDGNLLPTDVATGERLGDRVVVTSGLTEGQRVVASGTFLIDAESQLKAALGSMAGHQHGGAPASAATPTPTAATPASAPATPPRSGAQEHRHD